MHFIERDRQTGRDKDRHRETDRQTKTETETERVRERETEREEYSMDNTSFADFTVTLKTIEANKTDLVSLTEGNEGVSL